MQRSTSLVACKEGKEGAELRSKGLHRKEDSDGNWDFSSRNEVKFIHQVLKGSW